VEPRSFKEGSPAQIAAADRPVIGDPRARPGHPASIVTEWSVDPDDYGTFLCTVWDEWMARDFGRAHVNHFETAIAQALGHPAQTCVASPVCGKALAVEHDGALFSCVYPDFRLGNIAETHEGDMAFSPRQVAFGLAKSDRLPRYCRSCEHLDLCWGECPKNRLLTTPDGEPGLNYLCVALKRFYGQVRRDLPEICRRLGLPPIPTPQKARP
jgi:uncharacterized protein